MSELVKFEDRVKEKLKGIVADLIPEDRWDALIQQTVQDFEKNDLPKLVKEELSKKYKEVINAEFNKPEWQAQWNGAGPEASEALKKLIVESAGMVLASMIGGAMENVLSQFRYALQNQQRY